MALTLEEMSVHFTVNGEKLVIDAFNNVGVASNVARKTVTANFHETAIGGEAFVNKLEHVGRQATQVFANVAEGGTQGLQRLANAFEDIGFMINPAVGAITLAVAIIGEKLISTVADHRKALEEERKAFVTEIAKMANAGETAKLQDKMRALLYGTPFDEKTGGMNKPSEYLKNAFEGSLADLETRMDKLNAALPKGASMASGKVAEEYNKVSRALTAAREEYKKLQTAAEHVANQPAEMRGLLPTRTTAAAPKTAAETAQIKHDLAIRAAQLAMNYAEELRLTIEWADQMAAQYGKNSDQFRKAEDARVAFALKGQTELEKLNNDTLKKIEDDWKKKLDAEAKNNAALTKLKLEQAGRAAEIQAQTNDMMRKGVVAANQAANAAIKKTNDIAAKELADMQARAATGASLVGNAITAGFQEALSGGGVSGAFHAFSSQILAGLGSIMQKQGEAMMAQGAVLLALLPALSNPFTSGPALLAAGAALVALGATLSSISTRTGGGGAAGGGATSYASSPASTTGYVMANPYQPAPGTQATTKGMTATAPVVVNATIIGKDDPSAQRQIMELFNRAQLRAGG